VQLSFIFNYYYNIFTAQETSIIALPNSKTRKTEKKKSKILKLISLLQSAEYDGANEEPNGANAEGGGDDGLDGDEGGGVIRDKDDGGDGSDEGGERGGGEEGGGEAGGAFEQAEEAELLRLGKDAELLDGREREAQLLRFGEQPRFLNVAQDLPLLQLLEHVHLHLLAPLVEYPRPEPLLLPFIIVLVHLTQHPFQFPIQFFKFNFKPNTQLRKFLPFFSGPWPRRLTVWRRWDWGESVGGGTGKRRSGWWWRWVEEPEPRMSQEPPWLLSRNSCFSSACYLHTKLPRGTMMKKERDPEDISVIIIIKINKLINNIRGVLLCDAI